MIISRAGIGILTHFARMKRLSFNLCAGATGKQTTVVYAASRGAAGIAKDTTSEGLDTQKETSMFLESWRVSFFASFFFFCSVIFLVLRQGLRALSCFLGHSHVYASSFSFDVRPAHRRGVVLCVILRSTNF